MEELKENMFSGGDNEEAHEHIEKVMEIIDLFHTPGVSKEHVRLLDFLFTLVGKAKKWRKWLPIGTITTWELLKEEFLDEYRPPSKIIRQIEAIRGFNQEYKEAELRMCLCHLKNHQCRRRKLPPNDQLDSFLLKFVEGYQPRANEIGSVNMWDEEKDLESKEENKDIKEQKYLRRNKVEPFTPYVGSDKEGCEIFSNKKPNPLRCY
nr:hypothetical protein [Tanacetum cinerariifolium]